jgi:hypothetical protein
VVSGPESSELTQCLLKRYISGSHFGLNESETMFKLKVVGLKIAYLISKQQISKLMNK